jgi:outer membrane biosynthesis protein TonB
MNNSFAMSASLEAKYNTQASMITAGFAGLMILLMFLLKWKLPILEKIVEEPGIEVQLNMPEEPRVLAGGGGGGGNPVQAAGPAGIAPPTPPAPGEKADSKDIETDDNDKESPAVMKPVNPKPVDKVVEKASPVKTPPKEIVETPAPRVPKAVIPNGKTLTGNGNGGGTSSTYDRPGGNGTGNGVGTGPGTGGGRGGGNGGGNGTGSGTGTGPKRVSGSRVLITNKSMDVDENLKGKVIAEIKVSPDGIGSFVRAKGGSLMGNNQAKEIVREWLRKNRFNKSAEETTEVYEFNINY